MITMRPRKKASGGIRAMPGTAGTRDDGEPADEAEHFYVCPVCRQAFDQRDLAQVIHHAQPVHKPIPPAA